MAANRRKQDDKNLEILRELITQNGNKYCLDCNQRGPTYVNTTIGSFVCSKCSGMLRGLTPPHRVKSISMATFTPEEIEFIKSRGNNYCRRVWLGLYEGESVNFADEQSVKDFMSDKYEKKRYYLDLPLNSSASTNGSNSKSNKVRTSKSGSSLKTHVWVPVPKSSLNNNSSKVASDLVAVEHEPSSKLARPVNHGYQNAVSAAVPPAVAAAPPPVPDFPVDFSTANIYNSSQQNANFNNNNYNTAVSQINTIQAINFSNQNSGTNDRYAALADLDHALRQQNMMKTIEVEDTNVNAINKNPFQSSSSDLFLNKNPFFNGAWGAPPPTVSVNPFMPSTNSGGFAHSNNPFL